MTCELIIPIAAVLKRNLAPACDDYWREFRLCSEEHCREVSNDDCRKRLRGQPREARMLVASF